MLALPENVTLTHIESDELRPANIVKLTRSLAKKQMDTAWWQIGGSKSDRKKEGDHGWRWVKIYGEFSRSKFGELLGLETENSEVQGAIGYWTNGRSILKPNDYGAVFIHYLATAPRNRPWLVENPCFQGVGTALLYYAVCHSYTLGLQGRVTLVSLPTERTRDFYEHRGFIKVSEGEDGMIEMELESEAAMAWLREKGAIA